MVKYLLFLISFAMSFVCLAQNPDKFVHNGKIYVDDYGEVFTPQQELVLDSICRSVHNNEQILIVTVKSLNGYEPMDYAVTVGNKVGVGGKSNNGILVLLCVPDRQLAIATGGGIQGDLTDMATGRLRRNYANPKFKEGKYFEGVYDMMIAMTKYLSPAAKELRLVEERKQHEIAMKRWASFKTYAINIFGILLVVGLLLWLLFILKKRKEKVHELKDKVYDLRAQYRGFKIKLSSINLYSEITAVIDKEKYSRTLDIIDKQLSEFEKLLSTNFSPGKIKFKLDYSKIQLQSIKQLYNSPLEKVDKIFSIRKEKINKLLPLSINKNVQFTKDAYIQAVQAYNNSMLNANLVAQILIEAISNRNNIIPSYETYSEAISNAEKLKNKAYFYFREDNDIKYCINNKPAELKSEIDSLASFDSKYAKDKLQELETINQMPFDYQKYVKLTAFDKTIDYLRGLKKESDIKIAREKRIEQEKLEVEAKRRNQEENSYSSGSYSSSSWNSSSDSSWSTSSDSDSFSNTDFGGGSFDGGGSSGSW